MITQAQIEAGARALCRLRIEHNHRFDKEPRDEAFKKRCEDAAWQDFVVEAKAALEAAESAAWRPIEEAPDDGTPILVTGGAKHGQQVNCVPADGGWWRMQIGQLSAIPTHFRPLPTPGEQG